VNARANGVEQARRQNPATSSRLYSALQFNCVRSLTNGQPCDTSTNKCAISFVGPKVLVDYYDYSSYQSINVAPSQISSQLQADLSSALSFVQATRPSLGRNNIMVGEFGFPRDAFDECSTAVRSQNAINGLQQWGAAYGVEWQVMDNDGGASSWLGFGLYHPSGRLTLLGQQFQTLYRTQTVVVPSSNCPTVNQGGVVNGVTWNSTFHPGDVVSIFGTSFSTSGNTVQVRQNDTIYPVTAGSQWWYESSGQINATLPAGVVSGPGVLVYVTDATGVDSNGQFITIQ
jgi:hypothetical protein